MKKTLLSLIILLLTICNQIQGQTQTRDRQKEEKIEKQLEAINPSVVNTFKNATKAMDEQNYKLADSLYSVVYTKTPNFDHLLRRYGSVQLNLGNNQKGIDLSKKAVEINRSAYNLINLAEGYLIAKDSTKFYEAQQLINEAKKLPKIDESDDLYLYVVEIQISLQLNDINTFEKTVAQLEKKYPNEMLSHYYKAVLFAYKEEWRESKKEILKAQEKGLEQSAVDEFLNSGIDDEILKINIAIYLGIIVGIWILGLLLLYIIGKLFSRFTLDAIENNQLETSSAKPGGWLRSGYKTLMNVGGFYYYISLPIILILIVAITAGIIYLFLLAGTIPIKLAAILIIGAVISIYNMIRSLLLKLDYTDPGRELKKEEAPKLFHLTDEVAQIMKTRPIEEIRITPWNDLAVYETGTRKEKKNDEGKRILILGTSVLKNFKTEDFKAVLAHEYGHFTHRDTAGGEVAFRVQNDITKYFIALHNAEQNTIWNIAFHFLRLYNFIFLRISHGATRLQEVLADRVAAETFGTPSFVNGLTHVIKRQIEFDKYVNTEIDEAIESKRPLNNLYELKETTDTTIEEELNKILNSKTTEDDTHPSPADRFRYISGIKTTTISKDNSLVTDLFENWNVLTEEMTQTIEAKIERY